jgi:hypothetical protein
MSDGADRASYVSSYADELGIDSADFSASSRPRSLGRPSGPSAGTAMTTSAGVAAQRTPGEAQWG